MQAKNIVKSGNTGMNSITFTISTTLRCHPETAKITNAEINKIIDKNVTLLASST